MQRSKRKQNLKLDKGLEPTQSILKNDLMKTAVFSIVASIGILSMSFLRRALIS